MKLRIRSTATKETIRIDIPNSSSLFDLKSLISSNLSSTATISPQSIHLSLNQSDEITSSPGQPLHSLGLSSGDLLFFSLSTITNHMEKKTLSFLPKLEGKMGLTVAAIHAVFLDSGFLTCGSSCLSHLVSVNYTLPDLPEHVKNVILKFSAVGNHVSIYGCLIGAQGPDIYRLSLDSSKLSPLLASAVNELSEKEKEDVFQLWRVVKDRLSVPLLIDICQKNGLPLPPCFTRLPTDLKIMILEFLPGIDLARVACTCSEMRYLASNDELWKRRFLEEFRMFAAGSAGEPWKDKFVRLWEWGNRPGMERGKSLPQYVRTPRIMPVPWVPGAWRFPMIGGDYDRFLALGDRASLWRAGFNRHAARLDFSPNCNLGGGDL